MKFYLNIIFFGFATIAMADSKWYRGEDLKDLLKTVTIRLSPSANAELEKNVSCKNAILASLASRYIELSGRDQLKSGPLNILKIKYMANQNTYEAEIYTPESKNSPVSNPEGNYYLLGVVTQTRASVCYALKGQEMKVAL